MGRVELLWWAGCPSHPRALAELREELDSLGHDPDLVEVREIRDEAEAREVRFVGSPTIWVDGRDLLEPGEEQPIALTCRVYRLRDGRFSPTPDREDLREALIGALGTSD